MDAKSMSEDEVESLLKSLPAEQIAQDLAESYRSVSAGVKALGRELRTGNRRTVYPFTNLQQHQFQLIAEIQRYIQLHSDAFGVVAEELGTLQREFMQAYATHLAEVRIVLSRLDALEADLAELADVLSNGKKSQVVKVFDSLSSKHSKIKDGIENDLHQLSRQFSKEIGNVLQQSARKLKEELS